MRYILTILLLLMATGCRGAVFSDDSLFAPRPGGMGAPPEDAPALYKTGWDHGCKTGLSTMNQQYYKSFYKYKQDPKLANNAMYYKAWKDAYTYCRQYSFRYTWDSYDKRANDGPLSMKNLCILCPDEFTR